MNGRTGVTVPFQPPQSTSAELRGDVVQVKRTCLYLRRKQGIEKSSYFPGSWFLAYVVSEIVTPQEASGTQQATSP